MSTRGKAPLVWWCMTVIGLASSCRTTDDSTIYMDPSEAFIDRENLFRAAHVIAEVQVGDQLPTSVQPQPDGRSLVNYRWSADIRAALWRPDVTPRAATELTVRSFELDALDDGPNRARILPGRRLLIGGLKSSTVPSGLLVFGSWRIDPGTHRLLESALGFPAGTPAEAVFDASTLRSAFPSDGGVSQLDGGPPSSTVDVGMPEIMVSPPDS